MKVIKMDKKFSIKKVVIEVLENPEWHDGVKENN